MLNGMPTGLFVLGATSALCGGSLGATLARMMAPPSTSDSIWLVPPATKQTMLLGGAVGALAGLGIGLGIWFLYANLRGGAGETTWIKLFQVGLGIVMGGILGATIALALLLLDYHEFQVALLDFNGAPLLMGAALGGAMGGIGVALSVTGQMGWGSKILTAVGSGLAGIVLGALPGIVMAIFLYQVAWQTRPKF